MKQWVAAFAMCQSMFCALPCPWNLWEEKARDKMLLCLPLVGLEIGLIWWMLSWLCAVLSLPPLFTAVLLSMYPFVATGYIHLDGYMDVTDAVKSYRSLERRREILKDSHVGSFAVIGVVMLMLVQFACMLSIKQLSVPILILIPAVSRCCSILAVMTLSPMSTSQYINREKKAGNILPLCVMLTLALSSGFLLAGKAALCLAVECAAFGLALRRAYRSLEGMNGDISGYSITISECAALAVMALL